MNKRPVNQQVIVVTGASSGLGRAVARLAGQRGAKVVVTARNAEALDNCVANAIVTVYAEAERLEEDELRRVWDVNFFGVVNGYWAALPHLRASKGTFLHVSSALAYRGIPLQAAYCSSKAGLRA